MSTYTLGKVCLTPKGDWSAQTTYEKLDVVRYYGGSFICLQDCTGVNPVTGSQRQTYWSCCAAGIGSISAEYSSGRVQLTVILTDGSDCSVDFPVTEIPDLSVTTAKLAAGAVTAPKLADGAVTSAKISGPVSLAKGGTGAGDGSAGLKNLLAAGPAVLSSCQYGAALPASGTPGQLFFLTASGSGFTQATPYIFQE